MHIGTLQVCSMIQAAAAITQHLSLPLASQSLTQGGTVTASKAPLGAVQQSYSCCYSYLHCT